MHNVNIENLKRTIEQAKSDPSSVQQQAQFDGEWQTEEGAPQFTATIPFPQGEVRFECDFPAPMGGRGAAPNPLAYCFWGGLACYAMTFAQEAALRGIELRTLRGRVRAHVDQSRALGVTDNPPVEQLEWTLEVESDASNEQLQNVKGLADAHCPGVWCVTNPVDLVTRLE